MWNLGVSDVGFLASLTSLEGLGAGNNHISTFTAYPSLSHLRYLNLSGNPLASVSFIHDLPSLRELHVNAIGLSNLTPFTGRTNLEVLSLAGNGISDISPLATLPRLTWLSFWDNRLQDISALAGLTNLNYVDLRYNQLNTGSGSAARTVIALLQARAATVDYDPQNSPTSLVADAHTLALYHFDGAAAGTDSSGHGYDLAFTGGRGLTNGIFNEALLLPDMNAVSATRPGDDAAFDFGSGDFTVELFVKFNGFDHEQTLVEKWVGASGPGWTFTCIGAHLLRFHLDTTVYLDVDPNLETNTWYHLAAQRHGSSLTIWRDGVQLGEFTTSATATDTSMPLLIGKRNSDGQSFPMNGAIDEVRISSVARYGTVNVQPFITENPANQTVAAGSNAQFKVSAVGLGTLNYQWRKNGTNLAAATDDTLAISNARWADEAGYDVVISSGALSVTSRVATLEVIYSSGPVITYNATDDFTIANGNPNGLWSYGWMPTDFSAFNLYVNHGNIANGSGPMWHGWNGDLTPCLWKNLGGSAYGVPNGWLSLHPGPGTQPSVLRWTAPVAGKVNVTGQFLPGDGGYMQVAVRLNNAQWWHVGNSGSFDLTTNVAAGSTIDFAVYGGYGYGNTPVSASISYLDATTDFPPSITQQPQSQLAHVGNDVSFSVAANGTTPFAYQWRKGGSDLSSATNATLTV
ncbi:MAG TPA: leucine-rich repeat domain-containing protein, partial [Candidatus Paceibacterota bacterium]|nr:leucine-rich repeat domain-containing protein [Candidatus Paceibacterota bacterium]